MNKKKPEEEAERPDHEYLHELSTRLHQIPVMYGVDGYDVERLRQIAAKLEKRKEASDG